MIAQYPRSLDWCQWRCQCRLAGINDYLNETLELSQHAICHPPAVLREVHLARHDHHYPSCHRRYVDVNALQPGHRAAKAPIRAGVCLHLHESFGWQFLAHCLFSLHRRLVDMSLWGATLYFILIDLGTHPHFLGTGLSF